MCHYSTGGTEIFSFRPLSCYNSRKHDTESIWYGVLTQGLGGRGSWGVTLIAVKCTKHCRKFSGSLKTRVASNRSIFSRTPRFKYIWGRSEIFRGAVGSASACYCVSKFGICESLEVVSAVRKLCGSNVVEMYHLVALTWLSACIEL